MAVAENSVRPGLTKETPLTDAEKQALLGKSRQHFAAALDEQNTGGISKYAMGACLDVAKEMLRVDFPPVEPYRIIEANGYFRDAALILAWVGEDKEARKILKKYKVGIVGSIDINLANAEVQFKLGGDLDEYLEEALSGANYAVKKYGSPFIIQTYAKVGSVTQNTERNPNFAFANAEKWLDKSGKPRYSTEGRWVASAYANCGLFWKALNVVQKALPRNVEIRRRTDVVELVANGQIRSGYYQDARETASEHFRKEFKEAVTRAIQIGEALKQRGKDASGVGIGKWDRWGPSQQVYDWDNWQVRSWAMHTVDHARLTYAQGQDAQGLFRKALEYVLKDTNVPPDSRSVTYSYNDKWGIMYWIFEEAVRAGYVNVAEEVLDVYPDIWSWKPKMFAKLAAAEYKKATSA